MKRLLTILFLAVAVWAAGCSHASVSVKYKGNKTNAITRTKVVKPSRVHRVIIRKIQPKNTEKEAGNE